MKGTKEFAGHSNRIQAIKFDPHNTNLIVTGGWDNVLVIYDIRSREPALSLIGPNICGEAIDVR